VGVWTSCHSAACSAVVAAGRDCNRPSLLFESAFSTVGFMINRKRASLSPDTAVGMLKSFFSDIHFSEPKIQFFSINVYQPTRETDSDRRQVVRMMSLAVRLQRTDFSLVVPSAPRPRDSL